MAAENDTKPEAKADSGLKEEEAAEPPPLKKAKSATAETEEEPAPAPAPPDAPAAPAQPPKMVAMQPENIDVEDAAGGTRLTCKSGRVHSVAIGTDPLADGAAFKIDIETIGENGWVFAGVTAEEAPGPDAMSFGWATGFEVYVDGAIKANRDGWVQWKEGDKAVLRLRGGELGMYHLRLKKTFVLPVPAAGEGGFRSHLSFFSPGDRVLVTVPTAEEIALVG